MLPELLCVLSRSWFRRFVNQAFVTHAFICVAGLYSTIKYKSFGCYKHNPGMTVLEGKDPEVLDGYYKFRTDAVGKCALAAMKRRYEVLAVQDGGLCLLSGTLYPIFNKYGTSQDCTSDGKGGPGANQVYIIGGIEGIIQPSNYQILAISNIY